MHTIFYRLKAPFPPEEVEWRIGATNKDKTKGMALAYINARAVMERLDDVCSPGGWQCRYSHANGKTVCDLGLHVGDEWVWKADGAGDTDHEAEKGALSDAFKRSAVRWGIGRYLYKLPSPWVQIEARGRSYVIPEAEKAKLARLLAGNAREHVAEPEQPAPKADGNAVNKAAFIKLAEIAIRDTGDPDALAAWWKGDEQKAQRQQYGLTQSDVDRLKQMVVDKIAELKDAPEDEAQHMEAAQ